MEDLNFERKMAFSLVPPVFYPGVVYGSLLHDNIEKFLIFTIVLGVAVFLLYPHIKVIKCVKGFLPRYIIAMLLVSGSLITLEHTNEKSGVIFFLFLPSMFISIYLLFKSAPAKEFLSLCKKGL